MVLETDAPDIPPQWALHHRRAARRRLCAAGRNEPGQSAAHCRRTWRSCGRGMRQHLPAPATTHNAVAALPELAAPCWYKPACQKTTQPELPEVNFSDEGGRCATCTWDSIWIQGSMLHRCALRAGARVHPAHDGLAAVRRPRHGGPAPGAAARAGRGLAHQVLRTRCCACDRPPRLNSNPQVLARLPGLVQAARRRQPRMQVRAGRCRAGNRASRVGRALWTRCRWICTTKMPQRPVLDSAAFYADCRAALTDEGCMTVNLFGRTSSFQRQRGQDGGRPSVAMPCGLSRPRARATPVVLAQRAAVAPQRALLTERADADQGAMGPAG